MTKLHRLIPLGILVGFVVTAAGCIIAPDGEYGRGGHEHEHEHDGDRGDRHCDDHDEHCRDR